MRIVIVGAGKLGYSIAELLSGEQNDVVVIDRDETRLEAAKNTLDVLTIAAKTVMSRVISSLLRRRPGLFYGPLFDEVSTDKHTYPYGRYKARHGGSRGRHLVKHPGGIRGVVHRR